MLEILKRQSNIDATHDLFKCLYVRSTAENQISFNLFNLLELVQNVSSVTFCNSIAAAFFVLLS